MNRKTTKIILISIIVIALILVGVALFLKFNQGQIVGRIEFGTEYHLTEIRPTDRFEGAIMSKDSYIKINHDQKTGVLYLKGLNASTSPIPFIITNYKEGPKNTTIDFEYIIDQGEKTVVQSLQAISTDDKITVKTVESHAIKFIINEKAGEIENLDYNVKILVFSKESEIWNAALKLELFAV